MLTYKSYQVLELNGRESVFLTGYGRRNQLLEVIGRELVLSVLFNLHFININKTKILIKGIGATQ